MLHYNGRCEPVLKILQLLFCCEVHFVCVMGLSCKVSSIPESRSKADITPSGNGTFVGELARFSSSAKIGWSSFRPGFLAYSLSSYN